MGTTNRTLVAMIAVVLLSPVALLAQNSSQEELPSIDELRAPANPVFTLLGISPTAVERPNTPRAFALGLLNSTRESDNGFPKDLAIEFTPFWWKSHPDLTFEEYYSRDKGLGATIAHTFAVSLASTELIMDDQDIGTRMGLGFRFMLLQGHESSELESKVSALKEAQLGLLDCVPDDVGVEVDQTRPCFVNAAANVRAAGTEVRTLDKERVGWTVEFAAAVAGDFPDDPAVDDEVSRVGAWLTPTYHAEDSSLTFVGVGRYISDRTQGMSRDLIDAGVRLIWKGSRIDLPSSLSLEYVSRFVSEGEDTDRLVAVFEYRLPYDNWSLVASYGKTFDDDFQGNEDIVSTLGINLGLGRGPILR